MYAFFTTSICQNTLRPENRSQEDQKCDWDNWPSN